MPACVVPVVGVAAFSVTVPLITTAETGDVGVVRPDVLTLKVEGP